MYSEKLSSVFHTNSMNDCMKATTGCCRGFAPILRDIRSVNGVTVLAGFFTSVVYTQRRVPDTEKTYGYQEEVT
jgi:hypothetical protein